MSASGHAEEGDPHYRVVRLWIRRCVIANTTLEEAPSSRSMHKLINYLQAPATSHIAFDEICKRILDDKTKDKKMMSLTLGLLKRAVPKYANDTATLGLLLAFCKRAGARASQAQQQTMLFLQAIVSSKLSTMGALPIASSKSSSSATRGSRASSSSYSSSASSSSSKADSSKRNSAAPLSSSHSLLTSRFLALRLSEDQLQAPTFRSLPSFFDQARVLSYDLESPLHINTTEAPVSDRIQIIADFKKQSLMNGRRSNFLKKGKSSVQVTPYGKQARLSLNKDEVRKLMYVVVREDAQHREKHMIASRLLVKHFMGVLADESRSVYAAAEEVLRALLTMCGQDDSESHLHILNLVLNLAVHAHLLEDIDVFQVKSKSRTALACKLLWAMAQEVLMRVYHSGEKSGRVWAAALNLLLFFTSQRSRLHLKRLARLDARLLVTIIRHTGHLGDEAHRIPVNMLLNVVFEFSADRARAHLNTEALFSACGTIYFVVDGYCGARSRETRCNYFLLLFEFLVQKLQSHAGADQRDAIAHQSSLLLSVLQSIDAPRDYTDLFLYRLGEKQERALRTFISNEKRQSKMSKGMTLRRPGLAKRANKLLQYLDTQFVSDFYSSLLQLADDYMSLNQEILALKLEMLEQPESLSSYMNTLGELLHSGAEENRRQGRNWLFDLKVSIYDSAEPAPSPRSARDTSVSPRRPQGSKRRVKIKSKSKVKTKFKTKRRTTPPAPTGANGAPRPTIAKSPRTVNGGVPRVPMERLSVNAFQKLHTLTTEAHASLLTSPKVEVRRSYFSVLHRVRRHLTGHAARIGVARAESICIDIINSHCMNVVAASEEDCVVLMDMFDLMFSFITTPTPAPSQGSAEPEGLYTHASVMRDTNYALFLRGEMSVCVPLLMRLEIEPLLYMFRMLPVEFEGVREVLILLITTQCQPDAPNAAERFEKAGGMLFFKALLDSPNPSVGFHVSRFLSQYLQTADPENYQKELKKLLAIIPEDKIAVDFFHVLGLLGDRTYLTVKKSHISSTMGPRKGSVRVKPKSRGEIK